MGSVTDLRGDWQFGAAGWMYFIENLLGKCAVGGAKHMGSKSDRFHRDCFNQMTVWNRSTHHFQNEWISSRICSANGHLEVQGAPAPKLTDFIKKSSGRRPFGSSRFSLHLMFQILFLQVPDASRSHHASSIARGYGLMLHILPFGLPEVNVSHFVSSGRPPSFPLYSSSFLQVSNSPLPLSSGPPFLRRSWNYPPTVIQSPASASMLHSYSDPFS